jgi:hypothetical protein
LSFCHQTFECSPELSDSYLPAIWEENLSKKFSSGIYKINKIKPNGEFHETELLLKNFITKSLPSNCGQKLSKNADKILKDNYG